MSCKPYIFRLRTDQDVARLGTFINKTNGNPPSAWIEFFYRVDKDWTPRYWQKKERPAIRKGDILAAVTADVGPFWQALVRTGACDSNGPDPIFFDAEDLPRKPTERGTGILLKNMTIMHIKPDRLWKSRVKGQLRKQGEK